MGFYQSITQRPYSLADWQAGTFPPHQWDVADAIEDGWSRDDVLAFMRAAVSDTLGEWPDDATPPSPEPPPPAERVPDPEPPIRVQPPGVEALARMIPAGELGIGSEVEVAGMLADRMRATAGGLCVRADGEFWQYRETEWQRVEERFLRLAVHRYDGLLVNGKTPFKVGRRAIDGILSEVGTILAEPKFFDDPVVGLNARNTVIQIGADGAISTREHNPDDRFRFTIPARFSIDGNLSAPEGSMTRKLIDGAFLGDSDAGEKTDLIGEILGAAAFGMATRLPQPKAFVFLGETASNGKSTIASLIQCLLPDGAVSSIPPSAYEDERRIVNLAGKAANVADELSASAISGETFKAAVTGNTIEGRDLYRSAMTFRPRAIHVFTTNTLPRFSGGLDRGLQRRLVVLRFNRTIPENEIVADIADRIRRDELDILLGMAVAGARRLLLNGGYTIPASSHEALRGWLRMDPINEWYEAKIVAVDQEPVGGWLRTSDLFKNFKAWALDQGHGEKFLPPVNTFSQRLKVLPGVALRHRSAGTMAVGIGYRDIEGDRPEPAERFEW